MIRIGIVGCGRILAAHLRGYRLLRQAGFDGFRITALCARREDDARMYIRRGSGPKQRPAVSQIPGDPLAVGDEYLSDFQDDVDAEVFTDYRELIARGPIDAVNDFTTHALHHQIAERAFAHGKHLLTQKPLAVTIAAGRQMCRQAEAAGCVLAVFENFRFAPRTRYLHATFGRGPLGSVQMVFGGCAGLWWAPDRIVAETPWRHRKLEAGGIALDLGVHYFDQIRYVAGEIEAVTARTAIVEPRRVTLDAAGNVREAIDCDADDTFCATFETTGGAIGQLFASWAGHALPTVVGEGLVYYGAHGRATGDEAVLDGGIRHPLVELYDTVASPALHERWFPAGLNDSFALAQLDWLEAIRTGRKPETDGQEGLRVLAVAFAMLESHLAGRRVLVDDVCSRRLSDYQRPLDEHYGLSD
jgi:predicted dehydrogenase